jgi:hypothetical protein
VAAAGLPSIVEKPPAPDAAGARLLAALEPKPRIGRNRRFDPSLLDLRARLPEREALSIRLAFHYRRASWAPRVVTDEALLDLGPHLIDLAYWLSDSPLHRVRTVFRTKNRCTLELELGRARASLSCAADRPYAEVVEVRRANGRLLARRNKGGLARAALGLLRPTSDQLGDSLVGQLEAFCTWVGGGDEGQLASAADGVAVMDAIDAARRSDRSAAPGSTWMRRRGLNYADPHARPPQLRLGKSAATRTAHRGRTAPCHPRALWAGTRHSLETPARYFPAGTYPSLYSGRGVADHGLYYPLQWSYREQRVRHQTNSTLRPASGNASPARAFGPC